MFFKSKTYLQPEIRHCTTPLPTVMAKYLSMGIRKDSCSVWGFMGIAAYLACVGHSSGIHRMGCMLIRTDKVKVIVIVWKRCLCVCWL